MAMTTEQKLARAMARNEAKIAKGQQALVDHRVRGERVIQQILTNTVGNVLTTRQKEQLSREIYKASPRLTGQWEVR